MIHPMTARIEAADIPLPEDGSVVADVLAGNRESFAILVRRYQEPLYRFALGMVGSADTASDVVQESFVKAYTTLGGCREPARFGAWVHRIVRNRCLDHLKRDRRRAPLDGVTSFEAQEAADEAVHLGELRKTLESALTAIPLAQREAFLMKHLEERSYEEMSEMLDASVSALKMRVKRACEALREILRNEISGVTPVNVQTSSGQARRAGRNEPPAPPVTYMIEDRGTP